jgi:hypothetical protein
MNNLLRAALPLCLLLVSLRVHAEAAPAGYSAAELYNLANSYARAGKPGLAILNYERASLLAPGDPDVQANLRRVRASAHLPAETPGMLDRMASIASPFWMAWVGVLGLIVVCASLIAAQLSSQGRLVRGAALVSGLMMVGLTCCTAWTLWPRLHAGVVIAATTPVRVAPVPMGDPLFTLPEGEKVKITAEHDGFVLIETPSRRTGWVAHSKLAAVVPR